MPKDLLHFLATLATDADKLEAYLRNPDAAMRVAGLSESDICLAKSGDVKALEGEIGAGSVPVKHYYYWEDWTISHDMASVPAVPYAVAADPGTPTMAAPVLCVPVPCVVGQTSYVAFVPVQSLPSTFAGVERPRAGQAIPLPSQAPGIGRPEQVPRQ